MTDKQISIKDRTAVTVDEYVKLDAQFDMRLDKLVEQYYGSVDDIDKVMLWNGIDCMFDVKAGDIIELPNMDTLDQQIVEKEARTLDMATTNRTVGKTVGGSGGASKGSTVTKHNGIIIF